MDPTEQAAVATSTSDICQRYFQEQVSERPISGLLWTWERAAPRTRGLREGTPEYLVDKGQISGRLPHAAPQNDHFAVTAPLGPEHRAL